MKKETSDVQESHKEKTLIKQKSTPGRPKTMCCAQKVHSKFHVCQAMRVAGGSGAREFGLDRFVPCIQ